MNGPMARRPERRFPTAELVMAIPAGIAIVVIAWALLAAVLAIGGSAS